MLTNWRVIHNDGEIERLEATKFSAWQKKSRPNIEATS